MRIAIIVDHPQRDLAGLVLTAFSLCQRGMTCYLVPLNLQTSELWALAPDFVLLNFARVANEKLAQQLIEAGIKIGVLDTEGGVWGTLEKYSELLWQDRSLLHKLNSFCAWGPAIGNYLVATGFLDQKQLSITGCPRFDLYHLRWRAVLGTQTENVSDRRTGRVLINTNFSFANPKFASVDSHIKQFQRELGWSLPEITEMIARGRAGMGAAVELSRNLAKHFPSVEIVLRPHPFEQDSYYRRQLAGTNNITVDGHGPIQEQIHRADAIIQRSCTTAIEAGMASVPTLSPQWVHPEMEVPAAEEVSISCASYQDLRNTLEEILNGRYRQPPQLQEAINDVVSTWFLTNDGNAHKRVCSEVLSCMRGPRVVDERQCIKRQYGLDNDSRMTPRILGSHLRHRLSLSPDWSFRHLQRVPETLWTSTDKFFGVAEVDALAKRVYSASRIHDDSVRPVEVAPARTRRDYLRSYHGHTVTMTCDNQ